MLYCVWHTPTETSHSSVFDVIRRTGHVSPVVANDATGYYNLNITAHDWHARTIMRSVADTMFAVHKMSVLVCIE